MKSKTAFQSENKRLVICRHAKSSWREVDLNDFDRPLNKRGERDAPEMGRRLVEHRIRPDLIMTSPAQRAFSTTLHYAQALGYLQERIERNPRQYAATVPALIEALRAIDNKVTTLMLVGHNPESTELANVLAGLTIDNIPTSGIVALEFPIASWRELAVGKGVLLFFDYPKKQA